MELMVAMTITAIIVSILVSITGTAIDTWNNSREELRASRQAKAMIDVMANDFESMVVRGGNDQEWLAAVIPNTPVDNSPNACSLVFFTAATDRYQGQVGVTGVDQGGDISCVGYQLQWKDPVNAGANAYETFVLNRYLVDPKPAFEKLLGKTDATNTLDTLFASNYGTELEKNKYFVCENIFQFTLVFHVDYTDTNGDLQSSMVTVSTAGDGKQEFRIKGTGIETTPADQVIENGTVTAVEVSLTVLTDAAISQLRANNSLADSSEWVAQNSYQFSRLVQVPRN